MNELPEFNYNLQTQTPKMLHEQQYGIYGFHFPSSHSMQVHMAMSTLGHGRKHMHTNTIIHTFAHTHSPMVSLAICKAFSIR